MLKSKQITFFTGLLTMLACAAIAEPVSNRISVTVHGQGPDVVLVPGLTCSGAVWDATVKRFEGKYRLHVVQVAGFAGAPAAANAQGPVIQPVVDAVDAYIKSNHLKSPKIIGHSMGGFIGMNLAIQHPEDVGRLMVVDSLPFFGTIFGVPDGDAAKPQAAAFRDQTRNESQEAFAAGEKQFLPTLVKSPEGLKLATQWAIASDKSVVASAMYELMTTDIRPKLKDIKTHVTMLYPYAPGGYSQSIVDGFYQENFAPIPDKTLVRIDNSRHFIMFDQPEKFESQVESFLR